MSVCSKFYVYEHWRLDRDECFYVGKGCRKRAYETTSRGDHWRNIVAKLERTGSGYEVRLVATGLTEKESFALEKERIAFWRDIVDLANKTDGGDGTSGLRHSAESRKKMSSSHLGNQHAKGNKHTEEFKARRSEQLSGDNNPMRNPDVAKKTSKTLRAKGKDHATKRPEVRIKISEGRKGKLVGDDNPSRRSETKAKISASRKGKWAGEKASMFGKRHSSKSIELMRQKAKARWAARKAEKEVLS